MTESTETAARAAVLSSPTRVAVLRHLVDADVPVSVAALTARFGLHHATVRHHLDRLRAAGLVDVGTEATGGRGRPRFVYRATARAATELGDTDPYERLALLLTDMVGTEASARDVGRRAGRAAATGRVDLTRLKVEMASQGFQPTLRTGVDGTELVLQRCPYVSVAAADPRTVCDLHLGWVEGFTEQSDLRVAGEIVHDPRVAGCAIALATGG